LALITNESSALTLVKQRGFVSADDFSGAGEGGSIPQVTDDDNEPVEHVISSQQPAVEKLDDIAQGE
jgi:hypothetical protein